MILQGWLFYALGAAICAALMPLVQERYKANGYALAVAIKIVTVAMTALPALDYGLPAAWQFYALTGGTAILFAISDVIYFRTVGIVGAGVVSRLIPSTVIGTFILWFFIDPSLLDKYLNQPLISSGIIAVISLSAYFAMRLKKCAVSWQAVKMMWFVLFAAMIGPIVVKQTLTYAGGQHGVFVFAYAFVQASMMLALWAVYAAIRKPISLAELKAPATLKAGVLAGALSATIMLLKNYALATVEHPAYVSVVFFTDAVWVLLVYKLIGKPKDSDIWAGLGIVACAAALVILKSL